MSTVRMLCRPAPAVGFALAGLATEEVPAEVDPRAALEPILARGEAGVLLLEEELFDALPDDLRLMVDRSTHPVVIPFPGPVWVAVPSAEERVVELLRRAIGYRVRLR